MINKFLKPRESLSENQNEMNEENNRNKEIGWQDFLNCYRELETIKRGDKQNTRKAITYIKYCHDYIASLSDFEKQMICSNPFFETRFDKVNILYAQIEKVIQETAQSLAKNIKNTTEK